MAHQVAAMQSSSAGLPLGKTRCVHEKNLHLMKCLMASRARSVPLAAHSCLAFTAAALTSSDAGCHDGGSFHEHSGASTQKQGKSSYVASCTMGARGRILPAVAG